MYLQTKKFLKRLIFSFVIVAIIIALVYLGLTHINNRNNNTENNDQAIRFLDSIKSTNLDSANSLWPPVYTNQKTNNGFLSDFSDSLNTVYISYFEQTYIDKIENTDTYEIARIYYDFLSPEHFNSVVEYVYETYYSETIAYIEFNAALNDFDAISRYENPYIDTVYEKASVIHDSRTTFTDAVAAASSHDYSTAIELMRLVSPKDTIYYSKAIEKIDEYIHSLKEKVKNGS